MSLPSWPSRMSRRMRMRSSRLRLPQGRRKNMRNSSSGKRVSLSLRLSRPSRPPQRMRRSKRMSLPLRLSRPPKRRVRSKRKSSSGRRRRVSLPVRPQRLSRLSRQKRSKRNSSSRTMSLPSRLLRLQRLSRPSLRLPPGLGDSEAFVRALVRFMRKK